jgi:hypothetical protein
MDGTTKNAGKKAPRYLPGMARQTIILSRGAQVEIAASAGCSKQYVNKVVYRKAPCSPKLWNAISAWLAGGGPTFQGAGGETQFLVRQCRGLML